MSSLGRATVPAVSSEGRATSEEEAAVLAALPHGFGDEGLRGAVASVLLDRGGRALDAGVVLGDTPEVFVRPLPQHDRAGLEIWVTLLERRRAQLTHDVSGPATGVLAALETVLEYEPIAESSRSLLEDARAGILRMTAMLVDRGAHLGGPANMVAGSLEGLVARSAASVAANLDPSSERLELDVRAAPGEVRLDAVVVEGALSVLMENAWRHRQGQTAGIRVEAAIEEGLLALQVRDNGRGLEPATLRRAGELGFSTRASGAGLGLFLLRRAVSARGGAVVLQALPRGAVATVLLPLNAASR